MTEVTRWGILGTARIATKVAAAIREASNAELVAIGSRDLNKARGWAAEHGAQTAYGSYEAVLADSEVDAVYIPLPPSMHKEWTLRAAESGKHVLCEKPLAVNSHDAAEMVAACAKHNVQFMDGVMWLHHPREAQMRSVVQNEIGDLRHVAASFSFQWGDRPVTDFRLTQAMGGGVLLDLGWYCVDIAMWAFGDLPKRVMGSARMEGEVDVHFNGLLEFSGQRTASINCGFDTVMRRWVEVAGTEGSLVCDDFTRPWKADNPRFWVHQPDGSAIEHASSGEIQETCMVEAFGRAVQSGKLNTAWPQRAVAAQRVCEAMDRSAKMGRFVEIE